MYDIGKYNKLHCYNIRFGYNEQALQKLSCLKHIRSVCAKQTLCLLSLVALSLSLSLSLSVSSPPLFPL
jgi:hypothetical protein